MSGLNDNKLEKCYSAMRLLLQLFLFLTQITLNFPSSDTYRMGRKYFGGCSYFEPMDIASVAGLLQLEDQLHDNGKWKHCFFCFVMFQRALLKILGLCVLEGDPTHFGSSSQQADLGFFGIKLKNTEVNASKIKKKYF